MSARLTIKTGDTFGYLSIIKEVDQLITDKNKIYRRFLCKCQCGNEKVIRLNDLRNGDTKSCGCAKGQLIKIAKIKHNAIGTPEYRSWAAMKQRCTDVNAENYARYGGKGIYFCEEWRDFNVFLNDMGKKPSHKHSIERINPKAGYYKDNCKWADKFEQANNKNNNKRINIDGVVKNLTQWANHSGIPSGTINDRIKHGWCNKCAIFNPQSIMCIHKR